MHVQEVSHTETNYTHYNKPRETLKWHFLNFIKFIATSLMKHTTKD